MFPESLRKLGFEIGKLMNGDLQLLSNLWKDQKALPIPLNTLRNKAYKSPISFVIATK